MDDGNPTLEPEGEQAVEDSVEESGLSDEGIDVVSDDGATGCDPPLDFLDAGGDAGSSSPSPSVLEAQRVVDQQFDNANPLTIVLARDSRAAIPASGSGTPSETMGTVLSQTRPPASGPNSGSGEVPPMPGPGRESGPTSARPTVAEVLGRTQSTTRPPNSGQGPLDAPSGPVSGPTSARPTAAEVLAGSQPTTRPPNSGQVPLDAPSGPVSGPVPARPTAAEALAGMQATTRPPEFGQNPGKSMELLPGPTSARPTAAETLAGSQSTTRPPDFGQNPGKSMELLPGPTSARPAAAEALAGLQAPARPAHFAQNPLDGSTIVRDTALRLVERPSGSPEPMSRAAHLPAELVERPAPVPASSTRMVGEMFATLATASGASLLAERDRVVPVSAITTETTRGGIDALAGSRMDGLAGARIRFNPGADTFARTSTASLPRGATEETSAHDTRLLSLSRFASRPTREHARPAVLPGAHDASAVTTARREPFATSAIDSTRQVVEAKHKFAVAPLSEVSATVAALFKSLGVIKQSASYRTLESQMLADINRTKLVPSFTTASFTTAELSALKSGKSIGVSVCVPLGRTEAPRDGVNTTHQASSVDHKVGRLHEVLLLKLKDEPAHTVGRIDQSGRFHAVYGVQPPMSPFLREPGAGRGESKQVVQSLTQVDSSKGTVKTGAGARSNEGVVNELVPLKGAFSGGDLPDQCTCSTTKICKLCLSGFTSPVEPLPDGETHDMLALECALVALVAVAAIAREKHDDNGATPVAGVRKTHLIKQGETLDSIAEHYFGCSALGVLIANLNKGRSKQTQADGKLIVEVFEDTALELPTWAEVRAAYKQRTIDGAPKVVTIVVDSPLTCRVNQAALSQLARVMAP